MKPVLVLSFFALCLFSFSSCNDHPVDNLDHKFTAEIQETRFSPLRPKVDVLLVIDNSASMCEEAQALPEHMDDFAETLKTSDADFHIAVITTDMMSSEQAGRFQNKPGELDLACSPAPGACNVFRPRVLTSERYITSRGDLEVERLQEDLRCISATGTRGSDQNHGLDAARAALSPELLQSHNQGFLRNDAHLAVIFITDSNDCSNTLNLQGDACEWESHKLTPTQEHIDFFANLKGGDKDRITVGGIIAPDLGLRFSEGEPIEPTCDSLNENMEITNQGIAGYRYQKVMEAFAIHPDRAPISDICNPPYDNARDFLSPPAIPGPTDTTCLRFAPSACLVQHQPLASPAAAHAQNLIGECTASHVQVEVSHVAYPDAHENRACQTHEGITTCILNEGEDFHINTNSPDCTLTGTSIDLDYHPRGGEKVRIRYQSQPAR